VWGRNSHDTNANGGKRGVVGHGKNRQIADVESSRDFNQESPHIEDRKVACGWKKPEEVRCAG